jgi:ribosomal protein S27AE
MNRTYLFVPPEERSEIEALGAEWDSDLKCWYVDGEPPSSLARWSSTTEDAEFSIISNDAYVARTGVTCPHCGQETEVICIHCASGTASEQSLEQLTVFDIRAVNETLLQDLKSWPGFRRTIEGGVVGAFANHCSRCGDAIGDMNLHSEPDQVFFDIVHAASGAITLTPISLPIELSGNEHFVIE